MRKSHTIAVLALSSATLVAAAPPAADAGYSAAALCGSGYRTIDSARLSDGGKLLGRTYLTYNAGNGKNCVVTIKSRSVGKATRTGALLGKQGGSRQSADVGFYKYYAGPVYISARKTCVMWGGTMQVGRLSGSYESRFEHCG